MLKRYHRKKYSEEDLAGLMRGLPRYNAVTTFSEDPRFDFGFVDGDGYVIASTPLHENYGRPRMSRLDMQRFKYIAVLRGLDVGSSFYWVMNSGSVGFVMDTPFETFASAHFRPWEHYVPFREDCSNLVEMFEWAEAHQRECMEMARRASEVCKFLLRQDLRKAILHEVVASVDRMERA